MVSSMYQIIAYKMQWPVDCCACRVSTTLAAARSGPVMGTLEANSCYVSRALTHCVIW